MRAFALICAAVLLVPQLLIVAAFITLDHVTSGGTLRSFLTNVLALLDLLFGWGGVAAIVAALLLVGAGFHTRSRPAAAICLIFLALYSTVDLTMRIGFRTAVAEALIFLPATVALVLCAWTLYSDLWRRGTLTPDVAEPVTH